jgi:DNA repair photolyase
MPKGRGASGNPANRFLRARLDDTEPDGIDEPLELPAETQYFYEHPNKILNKVESPDIPLPWSLNPYQGCEHGCIYCYARNTHTFWGFSAGMDFEQKIIIKEHAPELLEKAFRHPKWKPAPVMFSGNTDCYQPVERKLELTRRCLEVFLKFGNPVGLITKNALILRDLDLLKELAAKGLANVMITITTQDEDLRRAMEPRTSTAAKRLETVRQLREAGVPAGVMLGPIIPGLNSHEFPALMEAAAAHGALTAGYTFVRLNGDLQGIFETWLRQAYPDRADKVLNQIREAHGGSLEDHRYGVRMRGEGAIADSISGMFKLLRAKHFAGRQMPPYNLEAFRVPPEGQLSLF